MSDPAPHRHLALAALLSFLFPGLGQAYAGQRHLAAILALPVVLLVLAAIGGAVVLGDDVRNLLLSATFLTVLLVIDLGLMAWRLLAIGQVGFAAPVPVLGEPAAPRGSVGGWRHALPSSRAGRTAFVIGLLAITVAMHTWAGVVVTRLNFTLADVFSGGKLADDPDADAGAPLNRPQYSWDGTERISFLLLGVDGRGDEGALTDTILVVSVDPVTETAVMVSIPRDTALVPLPDRSVYPDGLFPHKVNALAMEATVNAAAWCPDLEAQAAALCGIRSLERTVSLYLGIPIQHYARVDLQGFARLIDAVGGVELCLPGTMVDPDYHGPGIEGRGIELPAGCHRYDGGEALAYSRIRRGWIELPDGTREQQDDFKRSERQQAVLLELRREFAQADLIFELPAILDAVGATVTTDFPRDRAGDLATLLPLIAGPDIERVVLGLPEYVDLSPEPQVNYFLVPRREAIADEMAELFGADTLEGWYLTGGEPPDVAGEVAAP